MRWPGCFIVVLALASSLLAQPGTDREFRYEDPAVVYTIDGRVDFAEQQISADAEIEFRNDSDSSVSALWLLLPDEVGPDGMGAHFSIDSLLLQGVPQHLASLVTAGRLLRVPVQMMPGDRTHLLIPFTRDFEGSRASGRHVDGRHFRRWYPQVIRAPIMPASEGGLLHNPVPLVANYRVALKTDTSFWLIGPGELRNDREVFGVLPDRGDTIVPNIQQSSLSDQNILRQGEFYWLARSLQNFDIVSMRNPTIDRVVSASAKLTLYYSAQSLRHREEINTLAKRISYFYQKNLGSPANQQTAIVIAGIRNSSEPASSETRIIILPLESRHQEVIAASLAVQLAQQYFAPTLFSDSIRGLPWSEGAAVYAATKALHAIAGAKGYSMMEVYGGYHFPLPRIGQPITRNSPFAFMETVRAPQPRWRLADSLRYEALFVVPSALEVLGSLVSDSSVWAALAWHSQESRNRLSSPDQFLISVVEHLDSTITEADLDQWRQYGRRFDWSIRNLSVSSDSASHHLVGTVERDAMRQLPFDIGVVGSNGDTLRLTVAPSVTDTAARMRIDFEIAEPPVALILDPGYRLPDINRENNVYYIRHGEFRYRMNMVVFPAFARLIRHE